MTIDMVANLHADPSVRGSGRWVVADELGSAQVESLAATLADAIAEPGMVIVDFGATHFCDREAVRMLLAADAAAKRHRATMEFWRVLPPVRQVLEQHGLDWRIKVVEDDGL